MRKLYFAFSALLFSAALFSQQQIIPCHTDEAMKALFDKDPSAKARYEATHSAQNQASAEKGSNLSSVQSYTLDTIPVVFHILHEWGPENIPDSYVRQALAEVNRVHTMTIPDVAQIDPYFAPVSAANNYVFQLATLDPSGNCTNGIIRHVDPNTNWQQSAFAYNYTWDPTKYLNVYVVAQIIPPSGNSGNGIIVGYTYLPGTFSTGSAADVVVYNFQFLTGTNARSLAHEFGHWLDLSHTFGSTNTPGVNCGDDVLGGGAAGAGVTDDTPITYGFFSTCPSSTPNTCDVSNYANVQNVMDYSSCPKNFTYGQVNRMHNMMALSTVGRNNVTTASNKIATGVRYPHICIPIANFRASERLACTNTGITLMDSSSNATVTSWNWSCPGATFIGGTIATDSMPQISYSIAGNYAVTYTATNSAGSANISKTSYITAVNSTATFNTPWMEGFEVDAVPGPDWSVYHAPGVIDWMATSTAAATGSKSVFIDNFGSNSPGNVSVIQGTSIDISNFNSPSLTFQMAYQQQATSNNDKLQLFSSTNCGQSWQSRWSRSGIGLATVSNPSTNPFVPTPAQFNTYTVNINGVFGSTNVEFKFQFTADPLGQGNDIYLDNINIFDAANAVKEIEQQIGLELYPNPSSGAVNISFNLPEKQSIGVTVTDLLGRAIETIPASDYAAGATNLQIGNRVMYQPGFYFVLIDINGNRISKKVSIQ